MEIISITPVSYFSLTSSIELITILDYLYSGNFCRLKNGHISIICIESLYPGDEQDLNDYMETGICKEFINKYSNYIIPHETSLYTTLRIRYPKIRFAGIDSALPHKNRLNIIKNRLLSMKLYGAVLWYGFHINRKKLKINNAYHICMTALIVHYPRSVRSVQYDSTVCIRAVPTEFEIININNLAVPTCDDKIQNHRTSYGTKNMSPLRAVPRYDIIYILRESICFKSDVIVTHYDRDTLLSAAKFITENNLVNTDPLSYIVLNSVYKYILLCEVEDVVVNFPVLKLLDYYLESASFRYWKSAREDQFDNNPPILIYTNNKYMIADGIYRIIAAYQRFAPTYQLKIISVYI